MRGGGGRSVGVQWTDRLQECRGGAAGWRSSGRAVRRGPGDRRPRRAGGRDRTLPGAAWQRCRTHYAGWQRPRRALPWVRALTWTPSDQPDAASVHASGAGRPGRQAAGPEHSSRAPTWRTRESGARSGPQRAAQPGRRRTECGFPDRDAGWSAPSSPSSRRDRAAATCLDISPAASCGSPTPGGGAVPALSDNMEITVTPSIVMQPLGWPGRRSGVLPNRW